MKLKLLGVLCFACGLACNARALDREAFTFTNYDLEVRVTPELQDLEVHGKVTLRNDSNAPQSVAVLQISSTLVWRSIRSDGRPVQYQTQPYVTDIDHTGGVWEAIVRLNHEVAPRGSVELEVSYDGAITPDSTRLRRIGAPEPMAAHSDWDQISPAFTAVRGIGYVAWYPVAMESANLSEGNQMFAQLGDWKQRQAASRMRVNLCTQGEPDKLPTLLMNDNPVAVRRARVGGIRGGEVNLEQECAEYVFAPLGLTVPTFAIAHYATLERPALSIYYLPGHKNQAADYAIAIELLVPFTTRWFGPPREKVRIVELAAAGDVPFESGGVLFSPLNRGDPKLLRLELVHQLAHASFASPRPWIAEGLAHFAQALEREQQDGRQAALAYLEASRPALVEAEGPVDQPQNAVPRAPAGQPLVTAADQTFYGSKAMDVWWMLRDMVGEEALQRALARYRPKQDKEPSYLQRLIEAQAHRSLEWFFDDWVYRDRGLPDFRIGSAYPRATLPGAYVVTVTVDNLGKVGAEVPVIVRAPQGEQSQRLMVPALGKAVARIQIAAPPIEAVVNDGSVPESDVSNNSLDISAPASRQ